MKIQKIQILFIGLLTFLIFCGFVKIDVDQDLKRSGKTDIIVRIKTDSVFIMDVIKQNIAINPMINEKFTYNSTPQSATYKIINIDPAKDILFIEKENTIQTSLQQKESYDVKVAYRFPNYFFTYSINPKKGKGNLAGAIASSIKVDFTVNVFGKIVETNGL